MSTIRDVAKKSGVSVSTVSIVLNGKEKERGILPSTAEQVRRTIAELDYHPSRAARSLRAGSEKPVIALFWVLDNRSTFFMRLVRGIGAVLSDSAFPCEFVIHPYTNGHLHEQERLLLHGDYQGILIGALNAQDMDYLQTLNVRMPLVIINRKSERFPCCYTDPAQIGQLAAVYAVQHGVRRMGVAVDAQAIIPKTTRRENILRACTDAGITCPEEYAIPEENAVAGGIKAAQALLSLPQPPDMIYADTDMMALGVSLGCRMMGREDMPILCTCLNHPEVGRHMSPAITMIDIPGEALGRSSAQMVVDLIRKTPEERVAAQQLCECRLRSEEN